MNKVLKINILILLIFLIPISLYDIFKIKSNGELSLFLFYALIILILSIANLIIASICFATESKQNGKKFLLASILVLLIGFSTCIGSGSLINFIKQ